VVRVSGGSSSKPQASGDPVEVHAKEVPDVIELEWEEPEVSPSPMPKSEKQRESILLSDFFNC
jgi:hypothetical protein